MNYFDSSIRVQFSFLNQPADIEEQRRSIHIPDQEDAFNTIREEYSDMLKDQLSKGNNGLAKTKYITFGIEADSLKEAKPRLERIEADVLANFKTLGVRAHSLDGYERLSVLHKMFRPTDNQKFRFAWDAIWKTGFPVRTSSPRTASHLRVGGCSRSAGPMGPCRSFRYSPRS